MPSRFDAIDPALVDVEWDKDDDQLPEGFFGLNQDAEEPPFAANDWPTEVPVMSIDECYDYVYDVIEPAFGTVTPADITLLPLQNQTPESSCVCNAEEAMYRNLRNILIGWQYELKFSPMWTYQRICSRRHSGSYMVDAFTHSQETGHLPEDTSAYQVAQHQSRLDLAHERTKYLLPQSYHQNTPYEGRDTYPAGTDTAKYFKSTVICAVPSFDHACTALAMGRTLFNGRSGHSICQDALVFDDNRKSKPLWRYCDSYGPGRGDNGRLYDSRRAWNVNGAFVLWDIARPKNPLYPCGSATKTFSLEKAYELFPAVDRDLVQQLFDAGPDGTN